MADEACPRCGGMGVIEVAEGVLSVACDCEAGRRAEAEFLADLRKELGKLDD